MNDYISVKEFASKAGVSVQAVYQRLDKDLKQFTKLENGQKAISTAALKLFTLKAINSIKDFKETTTPQPDISSNILIPLLNQLEIKDKQLEEKDRQIAEKDRQIAEKDSQIKDLTSALINEQHSAQQAHALHAGTIKQIDTRENAHKPTFFTKWFNKH